MAGRKEKRSVEYFPHYVDSGKTLFTLEKIFGNDGYAASFKVLEILAGSDEHFCDFSQEEDWLYICARLNLDEDRALKILNMMAKLDFIDSDLFLNKVLWCGNLVENMWPVYKKRKSQLPLKPIVGEEMPKTAPEIPQRKGKERKGKKEFLSDSTEYRLSKLLFDKIKARNPGHKKPNIQTWSKKIDLMIRVDGRDPQDIANVIAWCQANDFWQNNILSTSKLKDQYDQLVLKMSEGISGSGVISSSHHNYDRIQLLTRIINQKSTSAEEGSYANGYGDVSYDAMRGRAKIEKEKLMRD